MENSGTDATFAVDLANGNYFVNVTMGDVNFGASQMAIAAEGNVVVSNMATYSGPFPQAFTHKAFLVTVGDGQLNLRFTGTTPNFFLNASISFRKVSWPRLLSQLPVRLLAMQ